MDVNSPDINDLLKDKKIVVPKESSRLYQYAKNSEALEKWIVDNYDRIKNGESYDDKIEFPSGGFWGMLNNKKRGLFATIHNANMRNAKVNPDGSFTAETDDSYNYEKWNDDMKMHNENGKLRNPLKVWYRNKVARLNNRAYEQQQGDQLEDLYLSMPLKLSEEEIKKLKKKYHKL